MSCPRGPSRAPHCPYVRVVPAACKWRLRGDLVRKPRIRGGRRGSSVPAAARSCPLHGRSRDAATACARSDEAHARPPAQGAGEAGATGAPAAVARRHRCAGAARRHLDHAATPEKVWRLIHGDERPLPERAIPLTGAGHHARPPGRADRTGTMISAAIWRSPSTEARQRRNSRGDFDALQRHERAISGTRRRNARCDDSAAYARRAHPWVTALVRGSARGPWARMGRRLGAHTSRRAAEALRRRGDRKRRMSGPWPPRPAASARRCRSGRNG